MKPIKFLKRHSSAILTCMGAAGAIGSVILAVRATPKALQLVEERCDAEPTPLEVVRTVWPCYIPTVLASTATLTCIFSAHAVSQRQQAALVSTCIFLSNSYREYREAVANLRPDIDRVIRHGIAKDRYTAIDELKSPDTLLFYEEHYGYFERTMLEVQDAEYQLNRKLAKDGEVGLNDFFEFLGLSSDKIGDVLGWSQEGICDFFRPAWIDFEHELVVMDDGMECYIINILVPPTPDYDLPF